MLGRKPGRLLLSLCLASMAMSAGAFSATTGSALGRAKLLGNAMASQSSFGRRRPPAARGGGRRAGGGVLETRCNLEVWQPGKPVAYIEPVFRPPAEAGSLILQVTNGCSWNKCTFCDMYTSEGKEFRPKPLERIEEELIEISAMNMPIKRIFLADGDAMTLPHKRLRDILQLINKHVTQKLQRVSCYCLPRNVKDKSVEELRELRELGLKEVYIGCESGDNEVLERINKGETYATSLEALIKLQEAGIKRSVMILNGLGGPELSRQHAENSAKLMNEAQPEFLSTLVVSFPLGEERFKETSPGFRQLTQDELFEEMEVLIGGLRLDKTIFRSDHASNYLALKGVLSRDTDKLLAQLRDAREGKVRLRPEWARGL